MNPSLSWIPTRPPEISKSGIQLPRPYRSTLSQLPTLQLLCQTPILPTENRPWIISLLPLLPIWWHHHSPLQLPVQPHNPPSHRPLAPSQQCFKITCISPFHLFLIIHYTFLTPRKLSFLNLLLIHLPNLPLILLLSSLFFPFHQFTLLFPHLTKFFLHNLLTPISFNNPSYHFLFPSPTLDKLMTDNKTNKRQITIVNKWFQWKVMYNVDIELTRKNRDGHVKQMRRQLNNNTTRKL